ncbi:MAG: hypothetical protein JWM07_352 [Candidatus Saccharibacteria bacterium]|nr:hypothetical protein [Candidatus Saccharibacteria bacterium]
MAFKVFTDIGSRSKEFISITENKTFGLSRAFLDAHHIGTSHKAVILYDSETKRIALHFSLLEPRHGVAIRIPDARYGGTIVAKSFFDVERIDTKIYGGRYDKYDKVPLRELGVTNVGDAFVITLRERAPEPVTEEEDDDSSFDFSKIPF